MASSNSANAADLYDAYSDCDCVTAPAVGEANLGVVSSSQGQVLVDGSAISDEEVTGINSELLTGTGEARVSVGSSCHLAVEANSQLLISQPNGVSGDLCVKISSNPGGYNAPTSLAGGNIGAIIGGALLIAGGAAGIVVLLDDDDRDSASP